MANLQTTPIENKFIFTNEGRRMLTAQLNGIRFAVLGAILVQGIEPLELTEDDKKPNGLDDDGQSTSPFYNAMRTITLEDLIAKSGIVIGLKGVDYVAKGNERIEPSDLNAYEEVLNEIEKHLLPLYYIPSQEMQDSFGNVYGSYNFEFDRTTIPIAWPSNDDASVSFAHICLIGKQYAETNDATFNVDETQNPVIVGVAQLAGEYTAETNTFVGGAQLLKEQNKYLATKIQLRFTLDENDYDIGTTLDITDETKEVLDLGKKLSIVNNGLKTDNEAGITMKIAGDDQTIDDLNLSENGALATSKTLMVADTYRADKLDEQWNAAGLVHIINKQDTDTDDQYKEQLILTSIEHYEDLSEDLTAYNAGMILRGAGNETTAEIVNNFIVYPSTQSGSSGSGTTVFTAKDVEAPIFKLNAVPDYDKYAVEFFGEENKILGLGNIDKSIFSKHNISVSPMAILTNTMDDTDGNIYFNSNYNYFAAVGANADNMLVNADYNVIIDGSVSNMLLGADANIITNNAAGNTLIGSNFNYIYGDNSNYNLILGGSLNVIEDSSNIIMLGHEGLLASDVEEQLLLGKYNISSTASIVYGIGTDTNNRKNALEFIASEGKLTLYKNNGSDVSIVIGGENGIELPSGQEFEADYIKTNKLDVAQESIVGVRESGGYNDYGIICRYSSATKQSTFLIDTQGTGGASLSYTTDSQKLTIANNHPYERSVDATTINNEYAIFMHAIEGGSRGDYTEETIFAHGDVDNDLNQTSATGALTVYSAYESSTYATETNYQKVNIFPNKIVFSEYDKENERWTEIKEISNDGETYNKIAVDVYVFGIADNFQATIKRYSGSKKYKSWITEIWENAPPIVYSDDDSNPTTYGSYASFKTDDGEYRTVHIDENSSDSDANAFADYTYAVNRTNKSSLLRDTTSTTLMKYFSQIPDGLDEIEINLYIHNFGDHDFGLIWLPVISYLAEKRPEIIINIHLDNADGGNDSEEIWHWMAQNYNEDQQPEFDDYNLSKCRFIQLRGVPPIGDITKSSSDQVVTRDGTSNYAGWWSAN